MRAIDDAKPAPAPTTRQVAETFVLGQPDEGDMSRGPWLRAREVCVFAAFAAVTVTFTYDPPSLLLRTIAVPHPVKCLRMALYA